MNLKNILLLILFSIPLALYAQDGSIDFIKNKNQFPNQVHYKANLPGGAVFLTSQGFTYNYYKQQDLADIHQKMHDGKIDHKEMVHFHAYRVSFVNGNKQAGYTEEGLQSYYNNYFIGNDATKWAGHVPLFKKIIRHDIYNDIDAVIYSRGTSLKYDFVVRPNADPNQILMSYEGVTPVLKSDGSLLIKTTVNTITEQAPYAYQMANGKAVQVTCHFRKTKDAKIAFDFPEGYDKSLPLIIDPVLVFSTFSGSTEQTYGYSATYDENGCLYAGGECFGTGWPVSVGAAQGLFGGYVDDGINKYSNDGTTRIYSTYYGGNNNDYPNNMMVNHHGELIVTGTTSSSNLAVTPGCFDPTFNSPGSSFVTSDIYIARFSADGSQLKAATYLGGTGTDGSNSVGLSSNYGDNNRGEVFVANNGNIYIANCSSSTDFPVTSNAFQSSNGGQQDGVVCELDSNLSTLIYSTYLGGSGQDAAFSLLLTSTNQIAVCGGTSSTNFPTTSGAYKTMAQGGTDGFVSILSNTGSLVHSTYLGTTYYDHAFKIQRDDSDDIFILGQTAKVSDYPVSPGVFSVPAGNIFIEKLSPSLSTSLKSTRMGNNGPSYDFVPTAFLYDVCGNTYFSGFYASPTSPLSANAYQTAPGSFWLGALGPDFTTLLYGTFFGPDGTHVDGGTSRFDPAGIIYHSACTADGSFPTTPSAVSPVKLTNGYDIASYKFDMGIGAVKAKFELANNASDTGCADYHVTFHNLSSGATSYKWFFGNGDSSMTVNPEYTFTEGPHTVTLIASKSTGCHLIDTAQMVIFVKPTFKPLLHLNDTFLCDAIPLWLNANVSNPNSLFHYHWEPVNAIMNNPNQDQVMVNPALSTTFTLYVSNTGAGDCVDSDMQSVLITVNDYNTMTAIPADTIICPGDTVTLIAFGGIAFSWSPNEMIEDVNTAVTQVWPKKDMIYSVKIKNDHGCIIDRNVHIRMLPPLALSAGLDKDIKRGESAQLNGSSEGPFHWEPSAFVFPPNALTPTVTPDTTTTYYLYSTSQDGCHNMDSVTIHVTNAMLPNAFSPNGDGHNDDFKLSIQDKRVRLKDFSVYNRLGQRVFSTQNVLEGWDGYFNSTRCDVGTYFYLVHYIIGEKTYTLKGDVTLIR